MLWAPMGPEPYPLASILSRIFFTGDAGVVKVMSARGTVGRLRERRVLRGLEAGAGRGGLEVGMGFAGDAGNLVESVSDAADEFADTFAGGRGNGVKFEIALLAEIAKRFETRAVGSGVQLGGNYNHGFFGKGIAE